MASKPNPFAKFEKSGKYKEPTFTFAIHSPARAGLKISHELPKSSHIDGLDQMRFETRRPRALSITLLSVAG